MDSSEVRESLILPGRWQSFLLLWVPILIDESSLVLSEFSRSVELELRLHIFVQSIFRLIVTACWVVMSRSAEAVLRLRESVLWLIIELRAELGFASQVY